MKRPLLSLSVGLSIVAMMACAGGQQQDHVVPSRSGSQDPGAGGPSGGAAGTGGTHGTFPNGGGAAGEAGLGGSTPAGTAGSTSAGTAGTAGKGTGGTAGKGTGGAPLACDKRFSFSKSPAAAGIPFEARFTDSPGYAYVDMRVQGPGAPTAAWVGVEGTPHTWTWTISGHGAGVLDFTFAKDANGGPGVTIATCKIESQSEGGTGGSGGSTGSGGSAGSSGSPTGAPPINRYGMGYVSEGNAQDHDLTAKLTGPGGYVTVIFADIRPGRTGAEPSWKSSIQAAYDRDLIPVIRMAPPWGDRNVRAMGESPTSYKGLAQVYKSVLADLPKRAGWPMFVQVHNEPNLCYEWTCSSGTLSSQQTAGEYAHLLADVADAVHGLGDSRIKVLNGALAPGGAQSCVCGTDQFTAGDKSTDFLKYMKQAVPSVFDKIDVFASHAYPASGEGWGFFAPYDQSMPGLVFYKKELAEIGKPNLKVLITETGWSIKDNGVNWSRDQVADWTVEAYKNVWLTEPSILGVTPFILRDPAWDAFAWTHPDGAPYPVYTKVRAYRCAQPGAKNCQ